MTLEEMFNTLAVDYKDLQDISKREVCFATSSDTFTLLSIYIGNDGKVWIDLEQNA